MNPVPHPDNDPSGPRGKKRRSSHFRKRRGDSTTRVLRVRHDAEGEDSNPQEPWAGVANDAPALPDPPLRRKVSPPAPLPAEPPEEESLPPPWDEGQQRLRRIEEAVGIVGLAILVTAMIVAMWLRMTAGH